MANVELIKKDNENKDVITEKDVVIGLIGNDTTEIISGLDEGDQVAVRQKKQVTSSGMGF